MSARLTAALVAEKAAGSGAGGGASGGGGGLRLEFKGLGLTAIAPDAFASAAVARLDLSENRLTSIAGVEVAKATLRHLTVRGNALKDLLACRSLAAITVLDLGGNAVTSFGPLTGLAHLSAVIANDNDVAALEEGVFAGCPALNTLVLSRNSLAGGSDALPRAVFAGQALSLIKLNLSHNELTDGALEALRPLQVCVRPSSYIHP